MAPGYVGDDGLMVAASIQGDVDRISEWAHKVSENEWLTGEGPQ